MKKKSNVVPVKSRIKSSVRTGANKKTHSQRLGVQTEDGLNISLTVRGMSRAAVERISVKLQDSILLLLGDHVGAL